VRSALRARDHAGLAGSNPGDDVRLLRPFVSELRSWAPGEERGRLARQRPFKVRPAETPAPSTMQSTASLAVSEAGFTLLGSGSRWREADDGDPVQVDVQHGGEAGLAGGGLAEIDRARSWWNNAGGTLELASGNRHRAQGYSASQVCNDTGVVDGRMSLYFGDPCDEIANDGTLAIGGFYSSGSLQNVNGTGFRRIVKGYVINSDEAGVQSWLGTSRCFEDVQAHELGHAIGIGHTSVAGNIMRPTINSGCLSQAPGSVTSPTGLLGADDIAALRYIYPADDASGASKPPQPTGTQASLTTPTVTWADNADNETRYKVYRKVGSNHYEKVAILPANSTSYYDTDMVPGEVHCYRVRAQNDLGYSPYSPIACVGFEVPERPAWVSAVATGPSRVEVTWADSSSNEDRFKVYRRVNGGSWEKVARIWAGTTFFADTTVSPGNRYCYRVRAQNALGYSRYSPWSCITP
jgi:hypothetical protein